MEATKEPQKKDQLFDAECYCSNFFLQSTMYAIYLMSMIHMTLVAARYANGPFCLQDFEILSLNQIYSQNKKADDQYVFIFRDIVESQSFVFYHLRKAILTDFERKRVFLKKRKKANCFLRNYVIVIYLWCIYLFYCYFILPSGQYTWLFPFILTTTL